MTQLIENGIIHQQGKHNFLINQEGWYKKAWADFIGVNQERIKEDVGVHS